MKAQGQDKISKLLNKEEKEIKQFLFDSLFAPNIKPSPLKSIEASTNEAMEQIDNLMAMFKTDVSKGFELFEQKAFPFERDRINQINNKLASIVKALANGSGKVQEIEVEELEFLEEVAKRVYSAKDYPEASCMFRFIIQLNPVYSPAWVQWALCETIQKHNEIVDQIYSMGMQMLAHDYLIRIYACDYYIKTNRNEMARDILHSAKENLIQDNEQDSYTFKRINQLISLL